MKTEKKWKSEVTICRNTTASPDETGTSTNTKSSHLFEQTVLTMQKIPIQVLAYIWSILTQLTSL